MTRRLTAEKKAELISIGGVRLDPELFLEKYIGRSTAGPGAGGRSVFFFSDERRVRLSIRDESILFMRPEGDEVVIEKDGEVIAAGIIEPVGAHCPHQAYITVSERCIFHCAFCPVHTLNGPVKSTEEVISLIEPVYRSGDLKAISLTGGIEESPEKELLRMEGLVKELLVHYDVPIGVSVYPTKDSSDVLHAAGAAEVKYNVETMDREIFGKVCPEQDLDGIIRALEHAVSLFGRDHVTSNIIIGLGESDDTIISGVEHLASLGVIPILRPVVVHKDAPIPGAQRPSAERLLSLGRVAKSIFSRYGLSPLHAQTMCLPCTGCDIIPYRDL